MSLLCGLGLVLAMAQLEQCDTVIFIVASSSKDFNFFSKKNVYKKSHFRPLLIVISELRIKSLNLSVGSEFMGLFTNFIPSPDVLAQFNHI